MTEQIIAKMIDFCQGNQQDIAHFLKVYAYARTVGKLEGLDETTQETLEIAAIVHDIACPLCREKYGSAAGNLQEQESEALLRPFLREFQLDSRMEERVVRLVCRHHTYTGVDGADCQILLEADYLVNAGEGNLSPQAVRSFRDNVFRTQNGTRLLNSMYSKPT
ncbi:HD domain-containing protein [Acutalibacter sp. 1XD8-33]|uniref:HD domain-containing protein n=1 Tax=Acutalibacter sp. 1XD8-33 TaxID=2320081 RepID=UPI000EA306E4|nr:HD domain-containing protein [Acutalibacter sp. 1XD8-33]RKJ40909.1 HD domain-containing protein [Acutalibacter sp. 1XD8-33]